MELDKRASGYEPRLKRRKATKKKKGTKPALKALVPIDQLPPLQSTMHTTTIPKLLFGT